MSGIGMKVQYKSGEAISEQVGVIENERRRPTGRVEYLVRWADGTSGWYMTSNLHF